MSSSSDSACNQSNHQSWGQCEWGRMRKSNWSAMNIAAMVLGFVFFWPVGVVIVLWILSGRNVNDLPQAITNLWRNVTGKTKHDGEGVPGSENSVFNDYQQTQRDRIREIKDEIKERARRFRDFRTAAKRRADEEEFNQFMSRAPKRDDC